jgi:predicted DNA-binding transcriptional regulator YafY
MPKKWNQDAKPSEKLLVLYSLLLFSRREVSLTELSSRLACSKPSVMRLINQLEASQVAQLVRGKRGKETVYILHRPGSMPKINLNAEGLYQLALCRDFLMHLLPESMRKTVDATLQQASAVLPEDSEYSEILAQVVSKGRIDYTPFQDKLQILIRCIREHKVCRVHYKSVLDKQKEFDFAPKILTAFHEVIYINGWIVTERGSVQKKYETSTKLALQRFQKITLTKRSSQLLPEPFTDSSAAFGLVGDTPFKVDILFDKVAATYVAEREWSKGQQIATRDDGSIVLSMTARSKVELTSWILGFGSAAEALSPEWLRKDVLEQSEAAAARYRK